MISLAASMFVTMFIGVLDLPSGSLLYCDAGHDKPIHLQSTVSPLDCNPHLPVGLFDDVKYNAQESTLPAGSTLFLYTDGLTEAMNAERKLFRLERVHDVLKNCIETQSDDLTMLIIRYDAYLGR